MERRLYTISTYRRPQRGVYSYLFFILRNCRHITVYTIVVNQITDLCSQVIGDPSRHRVPCFIWWLVVQSAAGALKGVENIHFLNTFSSFKAEQRQEGKRTKNKEGQDAHLSSSQSTAVIRPLNFPDLEREDKLLFIFFNTCSHSKTFSQLLGKERHITRHHYTEKLAHGYTASSIMYNQGMLSRKSQQTCFIHEWCQCEA